VEANSYDGSLFQVDEDTGYMTYGGGYYAVGVDVSAHQKEIDWEQVAASGVEFAIIRVGFRGYAGGTVNQDSYFEENIKGALTAGLDVGVYFFSQAVTVDEAIEEAEYTLKMIRPYNITYPVVFDWERQSASTSRTKDTDEETVAACAAAFCETVKAAGYTPMFYSSPSKAYKMELGYLADYPFWLAHYTINQTASSYRYRYDIWQYSSSGSVPGITGKVDMDISLRRF
jgi:GH25 family lysozyme M1 (1,4-beta-N-acetylmuramidase)